MPELQTLQAGHDDDRCGALRGLVGRLDVAVDVVGRLFRLAFVHLVTVGEQEVVGVTNAVLHAVFDNAGRARRRTQFLHLEETMSG